jgi:hypothetical protein
VNNVAALQAAAGRLSPQIIRKQLDYWTRILGPEFSQKERSQMSLSRFCSITQIECLNVHVDFPLLQKIALPVRKLKGLRTSPTRWPSLCLSPHRQGR